MDHVVGLFESVHLLLHMSFHRGYLCVHFFKDVIFDLLDALRGSLLELSRELLYNFLHLSLKPIIFIFIHNLDSKIVSLDRAARKDAQFLRLVWVLFAKEGKQFFL